MRSREYLAGFFDGEGSIYPRNGLTISAAQVDRRPLDILAARYGGRVVAHKPSRIGTVVHYWTLYGVGAAAALFEMWPFLIVKQEQATHAIAYQRLVNRQGCNRVAPEIKAERERLRQLIMRSRNGASTRREDRAWA